VDELGTWNADGRIVCESDDRAALGSTCGSERLHVVTRPQILRCHDANVGAHDRAHHEHRVAHIAACIADVGVRKLAGCRMFAHGLEVSEHLGRMPVVGQPVEHRH